MSKNLLQPDQLSSEFIALNRALVWAEDMATGQPAIEAMHRFLENLAVTLKRDDFETVWSPTASTKVFSILLALMAEAGQYRHETVGRGSGDETRYLMLARELLPAMSELTPASSRCR